MSSKSNSISTVHVYCATLSKASVLCHFTRPGSKPEEQPDGIFVPYSLIQNVEDVIVGDTCALDVPDWFLRKNDLHELIGG